MSGEDAEHLLTVAGVGYRLGAPAADHGDRLRHVRAHRPPERLLEDPQLRRNLHVHLVASLGQFVQKTSTRSGAGFAGQVIRLNAELLSGMIKAPDTWKALVQTGPGGLIVRDQSGFAGMMGLRNGDHIERANGIALAIPDDIGATVLQPLTRSQSVWVTGIREGKAQQWLYLNAGACPA